jgi:hypothetical protein
MLLGAFISAVGIAVGAAQGPEVVIGSRTAGLRVTSNELPPEQDLAVHPRLRLIERPTSAEELVGLQQLRRHTVGPFNQARFGFSTIDVYFDRTLPPEEEREGLSANGTLRLVVAARTPHRAPRLWLLEPIAKANGSEDVRVEPLSIDDQPDEQELVRLATADRSLPILDIQYGSHAFGANSGVELERHLLVDFRTRPPKVIALLDNVDGSGGGACTAYDAIYDTRREVGCRWDRTRGDFRCAETLHRYDTDWGERRGTRFFFLDSGQPLPSPGTAGVPSVRTLKVLAESALTSPQMTRGASVDPLGPSTVIETLGFGSATVVLVGSPMLSESLGERFGARLHAAVIQPGRDTFLKEIVPRTTFEQGLPENADVAPWLGADARSAEPSPRFTPDGLVPSFRSHRVLEKDRLKILQLTVSEGAARGVYLVGLDFSGPRLVADALLVATDAPTYNECNTWVLPATAVAMEVRTEPFSALLDVEPSNVERLREGDLRWEIQPRSQPPACRTKAEVTWRADIGFQLEWQAPPCVASEDPRRVLIDDQGRLTSSITPAIDRPRR